jgi:uncharacterized protein YbdZ (MbtH family)
MKVVQNAIQKYIIWPKKFNKDKYTWDKTCIDFGLWPKKLNTPTR